VQCSAAEEIRWREARQVPAAENDRPRFIFGARLGLCPYIGPFGVAVLRNMAIIVLAGLVVSGTALGSFARGCALRLSDL
jgi:hypothetical protein